MTKAVLNTLKLFLALYMPFNNQNIIFTQKTDRKLTFSKSSYSKQSINASCFYRGLSIFLFFNQNPGL
jgi:hypothetical protein